MRIRETNGGGKGDQSERIEVIYRSIGELKSDPGNPRVHSARQVRQIARSIETFGFNVPVLIDSSGNVVAGHGRIEAAKLLGLNEVPTICLEHLTPAQARAFMIADNRLTEISVWDDRLLAEQFRALSVLDLDFSLEVTGFTWARLICVSKVGTRPPWTIGIQLMICRYSQGTGSNRVRRSVACRRTAGLLRQRSGRIGFICRLMKTATAAVVFATHLTMSGSRAMSADRGVTGIANSRWLQAR